MDYGLTHDRTVLVTGGSGYLGGWLTVELLRRGFNVRVTIRDLAREDELRATIRRHAQVGDRLRVYAANLLDDAGWDVAADGADFVLHVASPIGVGEFKGQDLVRPAREGTRRVLAAARRGGARRVVMTSSLEAAVPPKPPKGSIERPTDETVWTDLSATRVSNYRRAKTLAEQDAWATAAAEGGISLTTVLPAFIQGPVLGADFSGSVDVVAQMLKGAMPAAPRLYMAVVDIRDIVELHLKAMTAPAAHGERFIGTSDSLWLIEFARILRDHLGERASKAPRIEAPDALLRLAALRDRQIRDILPALGLKREFTAAKAQRLLDWRPRAARTSIADAADSLLAAGLI